MNPKDAMKQIESVFRSENEGAQFIANIKDLKRKENPLMSLPGLKYFCDSHSRFRKIIIETSGDVMEVKMWCRANNGILYSEIRKINEPVSQPEQPKSEVKSQEEIAPYKKHLSLESLHKPRKKHSAKKGVGKMNLSPEERQRRRDSMKKYWEDKKSVKTTKKESKKEKV